jgi:hypothetical protein
MAKQKTCQVTITLEVKFENVGKDKALEKQLVYAYLQELMEDESLEYQVKPLS